MPAATSTIATEKRKDDGPPIRRGLGFPSIIVETASGIMGGALSTLVVHPLELVKTRLQIDSSDNARRFGASYRIIRDVLQKEGSGVLGGLYRGLGVNLTGNTMSWGLYFLLYGDFKSRLLAARSGKALSSIDVLACSGTAGVITAFLTNPLWIVKTRMLTKPAGSPEAYPTMSAGFRRILETDGPHGLMRGLTPAMFGVTHGAFQFMFYERLKQWRLEGRERLGSADYVFMSATAKVAAGFVTYPYKVVQARVQNHNGPRAVSPREVCTKLWRGEGVRGFYKGLAPNMARVLPSTCITFLVYEKMREYLG